MITEQIFYGVRCNRCGKDYKMSGEYTYYADKGEILSAAYDDGWNEIRGGHYCPGCCTLKDGTTVTNDYDEDEPRQDDERQYIPRPQYPDCVGKLRQFLRVIIGHRGFADEKDGWLHVTFQLASDAILSDLSRQMIERLLEPVDHSLTIGAPEGTSRFKTVDIAIRLKEFRCGQRVSVVRHQMYKDAYGKQGTVMAIDGWGRRMCGVQMPDEDQLRWLSLDDLELIKED